MRTPRARRRRLRGGDLKARPSSPTTVLGILNMATTEEEGDLDSLGKVARDFISMELRHAGTVERDPEMARSVRRMRPHLLDHRDGPRWRDFSGIAANIIAGRSGAPAAPRVRATPPSIHRRCRRTRSLSRPRRRAEFGGAPPKSVGSQSAVSRRQSGCPAGRTVPRCRCTDRSSTALRRRPDPRPPGSGSGSRPSWVRRAGPASRSRGIRRTRRWATTRSPRSG